MSYFISESLLALNELTRTDFPVFLSPMAGSGGLELALAVARGGGIASLPCGMLTPAQAREQVIAFREQTSAPLHLNFFAYAPVEVSEAELARWQTRLEPYYKEFNVPIDPQRPKPLRSPFGEAFCELVEEFKPEFVSFHFGLPAPEFVDRVKSAGSLIMSSATTLEEGVWLEDHGCDILIAQGLEAGGHRGNFLSDDLNEQKGLFSLLPILSGRCRIPTIAAGGIATQKQVRAARKLGACGVQIGTAYLSCEESLASPVYREYLERARNSTLLTSLTRAFSGRYARGFVNRAMRELRSAPEIPAFPYAAAAIQPLRHAVEAQGSGDFSPLWAGQSANLVPDIRSAEALTRYYLNSFAPEFSHI